MSNFKTKKENLQQSLLKDLVESELQIDPSSAKFKKVYDSCLTKLPNNSYMSVNSNQIMRSLEGLYKKFNVSSQKELSRQLEERVGDCLRLGAELDAECPRDEIEVEHAVLHFLLAVSQNPVNKPYVEERMEMELEESVEEVDWYAILCKDFEEVEAGDDDGDGYSVEDDISLSEGDLTSDDDDVSFREDEGLGMDSTVCVRVEALPLVTAPTYEQVCRRVVTQYWKQDTMGIGPVAFVPETNELIQPALITMSEIQIMREVIVMLQGAPSSFLFPCDEGNVKLRRDVTTPAVSDGALYSTLDYFHENIVKVQKLHCFCDSVSETVEQDSHPYASRTFRAFSCALIMYLYKLNEALLNIEMKIINQKEVVTLIALQFAVEDYFMTIDVLYHMVDLILDKTVCHGASSCVSVTALLNVLLETVQLYEASDATFQTNKVLQTLLICTLEPLLSSIDEWFTYGKVSKFSGEIHLRPNLDIDPYSKEFWNEGLMLTLPEIDLIQQIPSLIMPLADNILNAGKAIEMIKHLGKLSIPSKPLYEDFIKEYFKRELRVYPDIGPPRKNTYNFFEGQGNVGPSLLISSFNDLITEITDHGRHADNDVFDAVWENITNGDLHIIPSLHVGNIVRKLLGERCMEVRRSLVGVLYEHYDLNHHLQTLRNVFLMGSGLRMSQFTEEVYESVGRGDEISDWTIHFRECLAPSTKFVRFLRAEKITGQRKPERGRFSEIMELRGFLISYNVPFPLDVILDGNILEVYQQIFTLLLQINYAAWSIFPLTLNSFSCTCPTEVTRATYTFCFELNTIVKVIKTYVMDHVLRITCFEMDKAIAEARDLDEFMEIHERYCKQMLSKCLLTPSFESMLHLFYTVLNEAVKFRKLWNTGNLKGPEFEGLRDNVTKSMRVIRRIVMKHNRMTTITKPHFEWLEMALLPWN